MSDYGFEAGAAEQLDQARRLAETLDGAEHHFSVWVVWPQLFDRAGRLEDALAKLDEGRTAMRRVELGLAYAGFADGYGASLLFRLGRWDQAARLLAPPTPAALTELTENVLLARAELELGRGEIASAAQRLDQAQPRLMGRGWGYQDAWFAKLLTMAALRQGRLEAARATILAGLADVKACEELVCSAWLFGLGLRRG